MGFMGHPERELAAVHVAGTNGKGSVTAIVASVLQEAGLGPVGRYTSPHLVYFNERICINGEPVADAVLDKALDAVEAAVRRVESETDAGTPTFFECATALAFETFREQGVRLAAIETGLGGRLDATNVILPLVSAITCIGLEHCEYLGDTLGKIAAEKAGILKPGRPAVLGASMPPEARAVIEEVAARSSRSATMLSGPASPARPPSPSRTTSAPSPPSPSPSAAPTSSRTSPRPSPPSRPSRRSPACPSRTTPSRAESPRSPGPAASRPSGRRRPSSSTAPTTPTPRPPCAIRSASCAPRAPWPSSPASATTRTASPRSRSSARPSSAPSRP